MKADRLNVPRATIVWFAVGLITILGLFPAWCRGTACFSIGHAWIGNPPGAARLDLNRMLVEWGLVVVVAGALILTLPEVMAALRQATVALLRIRAPIGMALANLLKFALAVAMFGVFIAGKMLFQYFVNPQPSPPAEPVAATQAPAPQSPQIDWSRLAKSAKSAEPRGQVAAASDAKIIETVDLNAVVGKPRELVLWMQSPQAVVRDSDSFYCGNSVYGDFWVGPAKLSLLDSATGKLLNTVEIIGPEGNPGDSFPLPFLVGKSYYHVPRLNPKNEGTPTILTLRDLTGEGVAAQFVLFNYEACGIASTSVFGYNQQSDRAVQYPVEVVASGKQIKTRLWVEQIFAWEPTRPGYWDFAWHPGHGAEMKIHEQVSFDPQRQLFVDTHESTPDP